ncbi:MAG: D-tyrosyl-tRNA(Tyr) deacylase [Clostridia bacterium]|nr:D-tyrosyl-tRNA(Tyr) deacylase [Clostridia bacterium]
MRVVLQRVSEAEVSVEGKVIGQIGQGYLVLLGVSNEDTREVADKMLEKIKKLRIFEDENGKVNLNIEQVEGRLLVVSQFTLYADCKKGNRPSFTNAGNPQMAEELYEYFLSRCEETFGEVQHGSFGAEMQVSLVNDGPFTVVLDSEVIF